MKLLFEKWQRFVNEEIRDGVHVPRYYAFDWDDNLVEMPTKIILLDKDNKEVGMDTKSFAQFRDRIGTEDYQYKYAPNAFRNFRVAGDNQFLKDIMHAKPSASWNKFVECINSASIFAIITARGHKPSTLKRAVYKYIMANYEGIEYTKVKESIKRYNDFFKKNNKDASIKGYLDMCKFYPVTYNPSESMDKPEQAKAIKLEEFMKYCASLNPNKEIKVGFSDDDKKNIEAIKEYFKEPMDLVQLVVKYTGEDSQNEV